jgi:hypothetical protein
MSRRFLSALAAYLALAALAWFLVGEERMRGAVLLLLAALALKTFISWKRSQFETQSQDDVSNRSGIPPTENEHKT